MAKKTVGATPHHDLLGQLGLLGAAVLLTVNTVILFVLLPGAEVHGVLGNVVGQICKIEGKKQNKKQLNVTFTSPPASPVSRERAQGHDSLTCSSPDVQQGSLSSQFYWCKWGCLMVAGI